MTIETAIMDVLKQSEEPMTLSALIAALDGEVSPHGVVRNVKRLETSGKIENVGSAYQSRYTSPR